MKHRTPYWHDPDRAADEDDMPSRCPMCGRTPDDPCPPCDGTMRDYYVPEDYEPSDRDCDRAANMYFGAMRRNHD